MNAKEKDDLIRQIFLSEVGYARSKKKEASSSSEVEKDFHKNLNIRNKYLVGVWNNQLKAEGVKLKDAEYAGIRRQILDAFLQDRQLAKEKAEAEQAATPTKEMAANYTQFIAETEEEILEINRVKNRDTEWQL